MFKLCPADSWRSETSLLSVRRGEQKQDIQMLEAAVLCGNLLPCRCVPQHRVHGAFRLPSEVCSGYYITFDSVPVTSQKSKMDVSVISIVSIVSLYQHITAHCLIVWA